MIIGCICFLRTIVIAERLVVFKKKYFPKFQLYEMEALFLIKSNTIEIIRRYITTD